MHNQAYTAQHQTDRETVLIRQMSRFAVLAAEFRAIAERHGRSVTGQDAADLARICERQVALLHREMEGRGS